MSQNCSLCARVCVCVLVFVSLCLPWCVCVRVLQQQSDEPCRLCCRPLQDMRRHVVMTLLDTEQSYVESLRTLIQVTHTHP